jgi:hypothetical protein
VNEQLKTTVEASIPSIGERLFDGIFFLCPVSLVLYAFINSFGIFPGKLYSYIAYWLIIGGTFCGWFCLLNHVFSSCHIRLNRGAMEMFGSKLLLFKFKKIYACDQISSIDVKTSNPGFLFSRKYDVVACLKSRRQVTLGSFSSEGEALGFCDNVDIVLHGKPE